MNAKQEAAFLQLSEVMDKQDDFFRRLKAFQETYHFVPDKYAGDARLMNSYQTYLRLGSWRNQPFAVTMLKHAAKKAV